MDTIQIITLIALMSAFILFYFKSSFAEDMRVRVLYNAGMLFVGGILFMTTLIVLGRNSNLEYQNKNKCPQYKEIQGVYKKVE